MLKWNLHHLAVLVAIVLVVSPTLGKAQDDDAARVQRDIVGSWIVDVVGETRTRTLNVRGAEPGREGFWTLDSTYGWTDGGHTPISGKLVLKPQGYSIVLTTQANSVISADYSKDAKFLGTFTWSSGKVAAASLERLSAAEIGNRASALKLERIRAVMKAPGPGVSADCAAWLGGWEGRWTTSGYTGNVRFVVAEVTQDGTACNLSIKLSDGLGSPPAAVPVEGRSTKGFICNSSTGGYCTMKISTDGSTIDINYRNAEGGMNYAPVKKIALN